MLSAFMVLFLRRKGYLTRMFVTTPDHVLHENDCEGHDSEWQPLSLAVHPHRIDIEIHVVTGEIWKMEFEKI